MPPPVLPSSLPLLLRAAFKRAGTLPPAGSEIARTAYRVERIDQARLARYNASLGFAAGAVPVTFYYLLAQRAHLATMLRPGSPFRIAGMIHVANDLAEISRVSQGAVMDLHTVVTMAPAQPGGTVHVLLETTGDQDGRSVFRCTSEYLAVRGKRRTGAHRAREGEPLPGIARWRLAPSAGRTYAGISGDWNPIHLWPWSAHLMGLKDPIIHGMHTVAKACALLEAHCGRRVTSISARFKSPVALPAELGLFADPADGSYCVQSAGRDAVTGQFALTAATTGRDAA